MARATSPRFIPRSPATPTVDHVTRRVLYWTVVVLLLAATVIVSVAVSDGEEREPAAATPASQTVTLRGAG